MPQFPTWFGVRTICLRKAREYLPPNQVSMPLWSDRRTSLQLNLSAFRYNVWSKSLPSGDVKTFFVFTFDIRWTLGNMFSDWSPRCTTWVSSITWKRITPTNEGLWSISEPIRRKLQANPWGTFRLGFLRHLRHHTKRVSQQSPYISKSSFYN